MTAYRGNYELMPGNRITVTDVKDTLSLSTTNVRVLCTSSAINPWARYKPVGYTGKDPDKWWKGDNGCCGWECLYSTNITSIASSKLKDSIILATQSNWKYNPFPGGGAWPYRLGDFRNYYHMAEPPYQVEHYPTESVINGSKYSRIYFRIREQVNTDDIVKKGNLSIADFVNNDVNKPSIVADRTYFACAIDGSVQSLRCGISSNYGDVLVCPLSFSELIEQEEEWIVTIDGARYKATEANGDREIYTCLLIKETNGTCTLIPHLSTETYDNMTVNITTKPSTPGEDSGGGTIGGVTIPAYYRGLTIADIETDISFGYTLTGTFALLEDICDDLNSSKVLYSDGIIYLKIKLTNTSNYSSPAIKTTSTFQLRVHGGSDYNNNSIDETRYAVVYDSQGKSVSEYTVPAMSSLTLYLRFDFTGTKYFTKKTTKDETLELYFSCVQFLKGNLGTTIYSYSYDYLDGHTCHIANYGTNYGIFDY